jgi:hypothetical protein
MTCFSVAVGFAFLALSVAGLVVLRFTLNGWLVLLVTWSFGLLHIGFRVSSVRRARRRKTGRTVPDNSSEGPRPA